MTALDDGAMVDPSDVPSTLDVLCASPAFQGVGLGALKAIEAIAALMHLNPGDVLLQEGEEDEHLYIVQTGVLEVRKRAAGGPGESTLAKLTVGAPIGEMKLFGHYTSSATVVATEATTVISIPLDVLRTSPGLAAHRESLGWAIGHLLSERLNNASAVAVDALQAELSEAQARIYGGRMLLFIVTLMGGNSLIVASLNAFAPESLPSTSVISFVMITVAAGFVAWALKGSPYPRRAMGLSLDNAGAHIKEAVIFTMPVLLGLMALKLLMMSTTTMYAGRPLMDPGALFMGQPFQILPFIAGVVGYSIHAPLQEFIVRGGLQSTLTRLIEMRGPFPHLLPILISNLMFAAFHTHLGIGFALAAFFPGLLWGWLFSRQGSLVGPIFSHILLGVWAIFVLGLQAAA